MPEADRLVLTASGGFCAPIADAYLSRWDGIWDNHVAPRWRNHTLKGRLRNFFAWSEDWGTYMRGGPMPRVNPLDLIEMPRVQRGGLRFDTTWKASEPRLAPHD